MVDRAAELAGEAQEVIRQAGDMASAYYEQGQKAVARMENTLEQSIRDRPLQSILIASRGGDADRVIVEKIALLHALRQEQNAGNTSLQAAEIIASTRSLNIHLTMSPS